VYGPPLLLIGNVFEVALAVATGSVGVVALAAATMGYSRRRLGTLARIALGAASITLIAPGIMTDVLGTVVVLLFFLKTESEALPAPAEVAVERVDPSTPLAAASLLTPGESFQE
jgi:TRAP-type uncharacterized transport system fused permease subunit